MKTSTILPIRALGIAALAVFCLFTFPETAQAADHGKPHYRMKSKHSDNARRSYDSERRSYASHPSSRFTLVLGNGYAGRGYYYGPPGYSYYDRRPGVLYYATRQAVPRHYYDDRAGYSGGSAAASVQRALARRGYYRGYVDGQIGPQSRRAIARYQGEHGLRVTGNINQSLLRSLGLY